MDKKSEIARRTGSRAAFTATPETPATHAPITASAPQPAAAPSAAAAQDPTGWWMYHGDPLHSGYVYESKLNSKVVNPSGFKLLHSLELEGPVLSVPAVTNGYIYVGLANYQKARGGNGGALHKIDIKTGAIVKTFKWDLDDDSRDAHSFTGMGCTPAVADGRVYFGAFNGKFYCLDEETLEQLWVTDLRNADVKHNQPITNTAGVKDGYAAAVIWTSPVLNFDRTKLYVGCGEGENPNLNSFVFCLDTSTGNVNWIYCTNQFPSSNTNPNAINEANILPTKAVGVHPVPWPYTTTDATPLSMGCSVWGAIAYVNNGTSGGFILCPTGNQQPEPNNDWEWNDASGKTFTDYPNYKKNPPPPFTPELPSPGYSNGVLCLSAEDGSFQGFFQVPPESLYRPSDSDIDVGGAPVALLQNETFSVGFACKNGSFFLLDGPKLALARRRQLLPYHKDGSQIETVDAHPNPADSSNNPSVPNEVSNLVPGENFSGAFNAPAVFPGSPLFQGVSPRVFIGMGGPNYHSASPGIDYQNTPFMRAIDLQTLADVWPMDEGDPPRYTKTSFVDPDTFETVGMYTTAGESGLGSPAVVNDVVFCATSKIALYAFDVRDGTLLWYDNLGSQTGGYNGGYGYCLGPAIWQDYVVAGALVFGRQGGILNIYGLTS